MKRLVGAALIAFVLSGTASAQTEQTPAAPAESTCQPLPEAPANLPDGASATVQQMQSANERFTAWAEAMTAALTCRRDEATAVIARAESLRTQFNEGNDALNNARTAWIAEVEEFNARSERDTR